MGLLDEVTGGLDKVAREAQKVFDQGKFKVEQLQVERQMDVAARKLGYLEHDRHRDRPVDEAARAVLLDEIAGYEEKLAALKAAAAQATAAAPPEQPAEGEAPGAPGELEMTSPADAPQAGDAPAPDAPPPPSAPDAPPPPLGPQGPAA